MFKSSDDLKQESIFDGLEFETSVGLEDLNSIEIEKARKVDELLQSVRRNGMRKSTFVALEEISPGILDGIDQRRLTTNFSRTYADKTIQVALESGFFSKFNNAGGISNFFIAFYDWLIAKLTGHGSLGIHGRLHEAWLHGRRRLAVLHDIEKEATDTLVKYKSDMVLTGILKRLGNRMGNKGEYNSADIINALVDISNRANPAATPGLIALAKLCMQNNCTVNDYRTVAQRMVKHKNLSTNPAQVAGLAATRMALSSSILICKEISVDGNLGAELTKLSQQYVSMAKALGKMPMNDGAVEGWLSDCEKHAEQFASIIDSSRSVKSIINRWTNDSSFGYKLNELQNGTIGFWYDTQTNLQGVTVYNPDDYVDILRKAFEMNRSSEMDQFAKAIEVSVSNMQDATQSFKRIDQRRLDKIVGNYNNNSSRLRGIIKSFRADATMMLRISRILESYVNGYVRAFKSVAPFTTAYQNAVETIYKTPIR